MNTKLPKEKMGSSNLGWLESRFHFSFAEYRNFDNMNFGVLRVLNDDIVHPQSGFGMHPHRDMEIITYIIEGALTHKDSMGNEETLRAGEVQYLSAGSGIEHSEYNMSPSEDVRLLQIWILPPEKNLPSLYGSYKFTSEQRKNRLLKIVSPQNGDAKIHLYQDVNIYVCELDAGREITYEISANRQLYYVQISTHAMINALELSHGDAMQITDEKLLHVQALEDTHFLFIEMPLSR
jgi:hypothetical protein